MLKRKNQDGFNLSFLDVMACGLGAVLLILILVKFNQDTDIPADEVEKLQQELAALLDEQSELAQSLTIEEQKTNARLADIESLKQKIAQLQIQQRDMQSALSDQLAVVADLESAIAAVAPETANDPIATPDTREETYLLGLEVEGQRIGILVDMSGSMTHDNLIEIIRAKIGSDQEKQAGSKWQRTKAIFRWLLARLPESASYSAIGFNNATVNLGPATINRANDQASLAQSYQILSQQVPSQGTNLSQALSAISRQMPNMTHLYIVTDGLPTIVTPNSGFKTSRKCNPEEGKQATISGDCRMQVFAHAMNTNPLNGVVTNIILLPLEGDPHSPAAYWSWADRTRGTFIAPAGTWP